MQFSEVGVVANFDITPTSIHVERFTGHVRYWNILNNEWPIQKIELVTAWGSQSTVPINWSKNL